MSAANYHHKRRVFKNSSLAVYQQTGTKTPRFQTGKTTGTKALTRNKPTTENKDSVSKLPASKRTNGSEKLAKRTSYKAQQTVQDKAYDRKFDETFGDLERIRVKSFREAYETSYNKNKEKPDLRDYTNQIVKLSEIYQDSVKETENVYNVIRATGLLNICIVSISEMKQPFYDLTECANADDDEDDDDEEEDDAYKFHRQLTNQLLNFEHSVLKRVVKLKQAHVSGFFKERRQLTLIDDLKEMRDVFNADFGLLTECVRDLPDDEDIVESEMPTAIQLLAEDKIIAAASLMEAETFERARAILSMTFVQYLKLLGNVPCRYALIKLKQNGCGFVTPYMPWSCFLLIERDVPSVRTYFRNALALFSMKIVDIGETGLANLNIRYLDWLVPNLETTSGFSISNHVEIKKGSNIALLDCMRSTFDLMCAAISSRMDERDMVYSICDGAMFITGDYKLFKELVTIRQTVIQRQQADSNYAERMLEKLQNLVSIVDPFRNVDMTEEDYTDYLNKILDVPATLLNIMFDLDKLLAADDTKSRLEEMMSTTYQPPSSFLSIVTEISEHDLTSRFTTNLEDMMSPRLRQRWSDHNMRTEYQGTQNNPHQTILKELKLRKTENRNIEVTSFRDQIGMHMEEHPRNPKVTFQKSASRQSIFSSSSGSTANANPSQNTAQRPPGRSSYKPIRNITQPKNASNRVRAVVKVEAPITKFSTPSTPDTPEEPETPELFDRKISSVPSYIGEPKNLIDGNMAHTLTLLHYLVNAIHQSKQTRPGIVTKHELPRLGETTLKQAYLKVLQILLPMIESLREVEKSTAKLSSLKKMLYYNTGNFNELATALSCFHDEKYEESCQAIYSYLENRSDVTFVGEPFPCDFIEVSQELLEEQTMSRERYRLLLILLANCKMKRNHSEDALSYWKKLLIMTTEPEMEADINRNMVNCYIALHKETDALEAANKALALYKELPKGHPKRVERIAELREIIEELDE